MQASAATWLVQTLCFAHHGDDTLFVRVIDTPPKSDAAAAAAAPQQKPSRKRPREGDEGEAAPVAAVDMVVDAPENKVGSIIRIPSHPFLLVGPVWLYTCRLVRGRDDQLCAVDVEPFFHHEARTLTVGAAESFLLLVLPDYGDHGPPKEKRGGVKKSTPVAMASFIDLGVYTSAPPRRRRALVECYMPPQAFRLLSLYSIPTLRAWLLGKPSSPPSVARTYRCVELCCYASDWELHYRLGLSPLFDDAPPCPPEKPRFPPHTFLVDGSSIEGRCVFSRDEVVDSVVADASGMLTVARDDKLVLAPVVDYARAIFNFVCRSLREMFTIIVTDTRDAGYVETEALTRGVYGTHDSSSNIQLFVIAPDNIALGRTTTCDDATVPLAATKYIPVQGFTKALEDAFRGGNGNDAVTAAVVVLDAHLYPLRFFHDLLSDQRLLFTRVVLVGVRDAVGAPYAFFDTLRHLVSPTHIEDTCEPRTPVHETYGEPEAGDPVLHACRATAPTSAPSRLRVGDWVRTADGVVCRVTSLRPYADPHRGGAAPAPVDDVDWGERVIVNDHASTLVARESLTWVTHAYIGDVNMMGLQRLNVNLAGASTEAAIRALNSARAFVTASGGGVVNIVGRQAPPLTGRELDMTELAHALDST